MRILILQTIAQWTGAIEEQVYLKIPQALDMVVEEKKWFTSGDGTLQNFVSYLKTKGAKELTSVETWTINYL